MEWLLSRDDHSTTSFLACHSIAQSTSSAMPSVPVAAPVWQRIATAWMRATVRATHKMRENLLKSGDSNDAGLSVNLCHHPAVDFGPHVGRQFVAGIVEARADAQAGGAQQAAGAEQIGLATRDVL